jgi:hypothetical protein
LEMSDAETVPPPPLVVVAEQPESRRALAAIPAPSISAVFRFMELFLFS